MRKLITILLCSLFSYVLYGQFPNNHRLSSPGTIEDFLGAIKAERGFIPPFLDTLNHPAVSYNGSLTVRPQEENVLYISNGSYWSAVGGASAIISPNTVNKYLTGYKTWGTLNTDSVVESGNLYFTNTRARAAISITNTLANLSTYNSTTGVLNVPIGWNTSGNSNITASNFLGTTSNISLRVQTNSIERMRLDSLGTLALNGLTLLTSYANAFTIKSITDASNPMLNFSVTGTTGTLAIKPNNSAYTVDGSGSGFGSLQFIASNRSIIKTTGQYTGLDIESYQGLKVSMLPSASTTPFLFSVQASTVPRFYVNNSGQTYIYDTTGVSSSQFTVYAASGKGAIPFPRMPTTGSPGRTNILFPSEGVGIYNTTLHDYEFFNGTSWVSGTGFANSAGANQFYVLTGESMRIRGDSNIVISFDVPTKTLIISNTSMGGGGGGGDNNYLTGTAFSTTTGILTFDLNGLPDLTQDMNGYWLKLSDTSSMNRNRFGIEDFTGVQNRVMNFGGFSNKIIGASFQQIEGGDVTNGYSGFVAHQDANNRFESYIYSSTEQAFTGAVFGANDTLSAALVNNTAFSFIHISYNGAGVLSQSTSTIIPFVTGTVAMSLDGVLANASTGNLTIPTISILKGGSGQTTANAALNAFLPSQSGNAGKYLFSDGTNTAWLSASGSGVTVPEANALIDSAFTANAFIISNSNLGDTLYKTVSANHIQFKGLPQGTNMSFARTDTTITISLASIISGITSINKYTLTEPVTAATLTILNNKTFTVNNTMTLAGTDANTYTFPTATTGIAGTGVTNTFTTTQNLANIVNAGYFRSNTVETSSDFAVSSSSSSTVVTHTDWLPQITGLPTITGLNYRFGGRGSSPTVVGVGNAYANFVAGGAGATSPTSGTSNPLFAGAIFIAPDITLGTAPVLYTSTIFIKDAATEGTTGNYNFWSSGTGMNRFDGGIITSVTNVNGNLFIPTGSDATFNTNDADYIPTFVSNINLRASIGGGATIITPPAGYSYSSVIIPSAPIQENSILTAEIFATLTVNKPNITPGAGILNNTANLYISTASTVGTDNWGIRNMGRMFTLGNSLFGGLTTDNTAAVQTTSFASGYQGTTGAYTLGAADYTLNCTGTAPYTVTLPTATGKLNIEYEILNNTSGTVTLSGTGGQLINTTTTRAITTGNKVTVKCTGSGWVVTDSGSIL